MKITVTSELNVRKILEKRGMGDDKRLRRYLAGRVKHYCDKYVPMQQGTLQNTARVSPEGNAVIYAQPYAHYQYYGQAMAGRAPKHYTGHALDYHGAPMRGAQWDKRMKADRREDLEKDVSAYIGGKQK